MVSPMTEARWATEFLPPWWPASMYFFALSQAPPALDRKAASAKPVASPPTKSPMTPATPSRSPTSTGATMAMSDGRIISRCAPRVEMATQRS